MKSAGICQALGQPVASTSAHKRPTHGRREIFRWRSGWEHAVYMFFVCCGRGSNRRGAATELSRASRTAGRSGIYATTDQGDEDEDAKREEGAVRQFLILTSGGRDVF